MTMDRRTFLKSSLMVGAGAASFGPTSPFLRMAQGNPGVEGSDPDRYYIFCYFNGGWDILLSLDPRDPMVYTPGAIQTTGIYPGYELLVGSDGQLLTSSTGQTFGPYMTPLMPWLEQISVVRGMSMETLTHAAGMRRFLTGKPPSGLQARGSSCGTWLAAKYGEGESIPNLCLSVESYNVELPNYASGLQVNSVEDLVLALQPGDPQLPSLQKVQLDALLTQFGACTASEKSVLVQGALAGRLKAEEMVAAGFADLFDLQAKDDPFMEQLRADFNIPANGTTALSSPEAQGAAAVLALTSGMSRVANVRVALGLDTHYEENWTEEQGPNQERGFTVVAAMLKRLSETQFKGTSESWLDHTTLVGFSEFSRQPILNSNKGRDHSLTNACFVAGAGIQGGQVLGASSNVGMTPTKTNLATGLPDLSGEVIRPEHILTTLLHDVGITDDETDLRVDPFAALLKSS